MKIQQSKIKVQLKKIKANSFFQIYNFKPYGIIEVAMKY
jgi:hypothetical protein